MPVVYGNTSSMSLTCVNGSFVDTEGEEVSGPFGCPRLCEILLSWFFYSVPSIQYGCTRSFRHFISGLCEVSPVV